MAVYCLLLYLLTFLPIFGPIWFLDREGLGGGGGGGGGGGQPRGDHMEYLWFTSKAYDVTHVSDVTKQCGLYIL